MIPNPSQTPLVSVVMNCHNGQKYLKEAIDSVYTQTYQNWEIIFWDNGSSDGSRETARQYDNRLRYFRSEETTSLGAARKKAVEQARGEYLAFLDCDDVWLPIKLEKQIKVFSGRNYAACYGGIIEIGPDGKTRRFYVPHYPSGYVFPQLLQQFDIPIPAVVVRRSALLESGLTFDESLTTSEEYGLFMQLAAVYDFSVLPEVVAKYRVHEGGLTNATIARWADEREYTLNRICHQHPHIREKYAAGFVEAYARARYYRARYLVFQGKKWSAIVELRKNIFVHYRYFILFLLLFMPTVVWNMVHGIAQKRFRFS